MQFEVHVFPNGQASIYDSNFRESMHSSIGPWEEAHQIYIRQSQLSQRLLEKKEPLVIFDVGLGIASNAIAAIEAFLESPGERDLHLISFEKEITGLEFALKTADYFPFILRNKAFIQEFLQAGSFKVKKTNGSKLNWDLIKGDFKDSLIASQIPSPELVYYDFYSPKTCPELWSLNSFNCLFKTTQTRRDRGLGTTLFTYTSSTAARSALLLAGFFVGYGISTDSKKETTLATTRFQDLPRPLGEPWLKHWHRSSKRLPMDAEPQHNEILVKLFRGT